MFGDQLGQCMGKEPAGLAIVSGMLATHQEALGMAVLV